MGNDNMSRMLIETVVRKTIKDIGESPERSTRNLVDMALHFSGGRFQKWLFETAQTMLKNENSAYYRLVRDTVEYVDTEHLLNFGMNLGYNSCTQGAGIIRNWEARSGYNVPWGIIFELDKFPSQKCPNRYYHAIAEGEELGIFTWILFVRNNLRDVFPLIEQYPDSAFLLFCDAEKVTAEFIDRVSSLDNVMIFIRHSEKASDICNILRQEKLLYGVYYCYSEKDMESIASGDLFYGIQQLHPVATVFVNTLDCPPQIRDRVYRLILDARCSQEYQTLLWELYSDMCFVDEIISDDSCFVYFDKDGNLYNGNNNLFYHSLKEILMKNFPKIK